MPRTSLRFDSISFATHVDTLLKNLNIAPKNIDIFHLAFVHRSVLNEAKSGYTQSNERLEYLGDAVLEMVITERIYHDYPAHNEGQLTDMRSAMVRGRNLAYIAEKLQFGTCIILSRGESLGKGQNNPYILANTFEAFIGAIYIDLGMPAARDFILEHVYATLDRIMSEGLYVDPKSHLQEITQSIWGEIPVYTVVSEVGSDHSKVYTIEAHLADILLGVGTGSSKKKGEGETAEHAISRRAEWEPQIPLRRKTGR